MTAKMDGENTTIYSDGYSHARSLDSAYHPSRSIVKQLAAQISHQIPEGMRICGENLYAQHSIAYSAIVDYFQAFSIWEGNVCLDWESTVNYCSILEIEHVPVIWSGTFTGEVDALEIFGTYCQNIDREVEGFVIRLFDNFHYEKFSSSVVKWVRPGHVVTSSHWAHDELIPNKLE
jgi:hypothetical protein